MENLSLVVICVLAVGFQACQGASWSYKGSHGVDLWATDFPDYCSGSSQSPIDLTSRLVNYDDGLEAFSFSNFDNTNGVTWSIFNNGHTAQVNYESGTLRVTGGSLGTSYQVAQFHFHWGADNSQGSEHTVDGTAYPMEVHIVCFNHGKYADLGQAVGHADGLAVLGFFFEIANDMNPTVQKIVDKLSNITYGGNSTTMDAFALTNLMAGVDKYYRYQGGLTTPTCNEVVTWTVFAETIKISASQMGAFRTLIDADDAVMVDNYRPVQALNNREIRASFEDERFASSSARLVFSSLAFVASLVLSLWVRL